MHQADVGSARRRVRPLRFMKPTERPRQLAGHRRRTTVVLGVDPFAFAVLQRVERCVESFPQTTVGDGLVGATPSRSEARRANARRHGSTDELPVRGRRPRVVDVPRVRPLRGPHRAGPIWARAELSRPLRVQPLHAARSMRRATRLQTVCSRVARRERAWPHMDHSTTRGQVSCLRQEQRGGWTFTLGTCQCDFRESACLLCPGPTVTSMKGSLGSCQSEQRPWLTYPVLSRVLVVKLGRTSYIGAGETRY